MHNRIEKKREVTGMVPRICPAKVGIGHANGGKKLENVHAPAEGVFDVASPPLSGTDIPNNNNS